MKDIKLGDFWTRNYYGLTWLAFIFSGALPLWIIAIALYSYGKNTIENTTKKKGLLNMTYQKFIFVSGSIILVMFIIATIWVASL